MRTLRVCLLFASVVTLMSSSSWAWAQAESQNEDRSNDAQVDNQATNDSSSAQDERQASQNQGQDAQSSDDSSADRNDANDRRDQRLDDRRERRQEGGLFGSRDRQPAIGVSVVERGGLGVRVMTVVPDSPAAQAGIRPGDTILEVEGRRVESARGLVALIQNEEAGDTAEFAVIRDGREYQVPVRLTTRAQALPARLRSNDGTQSEGNQSFGQRNEGFQQAQSEYERNAQNDQQYGQSSQPGGRYNPPALPRPGAQQNADSTRQAAYGESDDEDSRGDLGGRLAQRLIQFEQRLERLSERLEQLERNGGIRFQAGSTEDSPTTSPNAGESKSAVDATTSDEGHRSENESGEQ